MITYVNVTVHFRAENNQEPQHKKCANVRMLKIRMAKIQEARNQNCNRLSAKDCSHKFEKRFPNTNSPILLTISRDIAWILTFLYHLCILIVKSVTNLRIWQRIFDT